MHKKWIKYWNCHITEWYEMNNTWGSEWVEQYTVKRVQYIMSTADYYTVKNHLHAIVNKSQYECTINNNQPNKNFEPHCAT